MFINLYLMAGIPETDFNLHMYEIYQKLSLISVFRLFRYLPDIAMTPFKIKFSSSMFASYLFDTLYTRKSFDA